MSDASSPAPPAKRGWLGYVLTAIVAAAATYLIAYLLLNIQDRKQEGQEHFLKLVELDETTVDPAIWGRNFPRQYDGYLKTADNHPSGHGGSDSLSPSKLEADPRLKRIWAGYAFSVDYREKRGHA